MACSTPALQEAIEVQEGHVAIVIEDPCIIRSEETDGVIQMDDIEMTVGDPHDPDAETLWNFFGRKVPKNEAMYLCQVAVLCFIIVSCVVNLSLDHRSKEMWASVLSWAVGTILPSPSYDRTKKRKKSEKESRGISSQGESEETVNERMESVI